MKIFICGGSAVGKTTFVEHMCDKYGFAQDDEIIRNFPTEWFQVRPVLHREVLFLLGQILKEWKDVEQDTIFDRSLIDVVAWMVDSEHDDLLYKFVADNFVKEGDLYIITPPETEDWVREHFDDYRKDLIRWTCMTSKLGDFFYLHWCEYESHEDRFIEDYVKFMQFEREVFKKILEKSKANYYFCETLDGYLWQREAEKKILEFIDVSA